MLKMLDISDPRYVAKGKAVQLVSVLDRVDPAVVKAVLEQYPQFANVLPEPAGDWNEDIGKALEEDGKITHSGSTLRCPARGTFGIWQTPHPCASASSAVACTVMESGEVPGGRRSR